MSPQLKKKGRQVSQWDKGLKLAFGNCYLCFCCHFSYLHCKVYCTGTLNLVFAWILICFLIVDLVKNKFPVFQTRRYLLYKIPVLTFGNLTAIPVNILFSLNARVDRTLICGQSEIKQDED